MWKMVIVLFGEMFFIFGVGMLWSMVCSGGGQPWCDRRGYLRAEPATPAMHMPR